jgi:hypothetical protein
MAPPRAALVVAAAAAAGVAAQQPIWVSSGTAAEYALFVSPTFVALSGDYAPRLYITARQTIVRHPLRGNGNTDSKLHASYKLWVNGALVTAGPGRNVPDTLQAVDAIDLRPWVVADGATPNVLQVAAYWSNATNVPGELPRLWAYVDDGTGTGRRLVPSGPTWQAVDATAYFNAGADQDSAAGGWYQLPAQNTLASAAPAGFPFTNATKAASGAGWAPAVVQSPFDLPTAVKPAAPPVAYYRSPCYVTCVKRAGGTCASFVVDYGQQIQGGYAFTLPRGSGGGAGSLSLAQGEALNADGTVACPSQSHVDYASSVRLAGATDAQLTLLVDHEWHQFRWIQVTGWPTASGLPDSPADVAAWAMAYPVAGMVADPATGAPVPVIGSPWDRSCGFNATALAAARHPLAAAAKAWQLEAAAPSPAASPDTAAVSVAAAAEPFASMGDVSTNLPDLDAVWALCARSMTATALDVNVDSQTRQRDLCHVDALITAQGQYATVARGAGAWGAAALAAPAAAAVVAASAAVAAAPDFGTAYMQRSAHYASRNVSDPWVTWTEFRLAAAGLVMEHALQTGDTSLAAGIYDASNERTAANLTLQFFAQVRYWNASGGGLLSYTDCGGPWLCDALVDWPTTTRDGYVFNNQDAVRNGFGALVLDGLAWTAGVLGHADDAARYAAMAAAVKAGIYAHMLADDPSGGSAHFTDGVGVTHAALHSTLYAVAGGALDAAPDDATRAALAPRLTTYLRSRGMGPASCMSGKWMLQALGVLGRWDAGASALAVAYLTAPGYPGWLNMIALNATVTLEAWRPQDKANMDWGHPWCAGPAVALPRWVGGVEPTGAGWATWRAAPQLAGASAGSGTPLTSLTLRAPTPYGPIGLAVTVATTRPAAGGVSANITLAVPAGAPAGSGTVCAAGPTDTAVPPPAGDSLVLDGVTVTAAVPWGRFLCTPADGGVGPGAHSVLRLRGA